MVMAEGEGQEQEEREERRKKRKMAEAERRSTSTGSVTTIPFEDDDDDEESSAIFGSLSLHPFLSVDLDFIYSGVYWRLERSPAARTSLDPNLCSEF